MPDVAVPAEQGFVAKSNMGYVACDAMRWCEQWYSHVFKPTSAKRVVTIANVTLWEVCTWRKWRFGFAGVFQWVIVATDVTMSLWKPIDGYVL